MTRRHSTLSALVSGGAAAALIAGLIALPGQSAAAAEFTLKVAIFPTDEIHHEFGRKYEYSKHATLLVD